MTAMKIDKVNEKVFDEVKETENKFDKSESEEEEVEGRKLKHGRGYGGKHQRKHCGGGFCIFMFFVTLVSYLLTLNRFMRTLKNLTDLRAAQASPEIANDEE